MLSSDVIVALQLELAFAKAEKARVDKKIAGLVAVIEDDERQRVGFMTAVSTPDGHITLKETKPIPSPTPPKAANERKEP
jgi:hypothetical protein